MSKNLIILVLLIVIGLLLYFYIKARRDKDMAMVYVSLIIKGRRTYSSVPNLLKPQVREILIDLELEYLIDEEG